jgi:hypothetical protein
MTDLLDPSKLGARDEVLSRPCPVPKEPGAYAWYFRAVPPGVATKGCLWHDSHSLLYPP